MFKVNIIFFARILKEKLCVFLDSILFSILVNIYFYALDFYVLE